MRFGIWFAPKNLLEVAHYCELAEQEGFDFVGITDGQMIWRDVYVALSLISQKTSRIKLGPWVTNPVTRDPTVTASAISTLNELSNNRAQMGIGIGGDSVETVSKKPAKLEDCKVALQLIKDLVAGKRIEWKNQKIRLASASGKIPIYWGAANPKSLKFGGQYADGVIISGWIDDEVLSSMREDALEGVKEAGRSTDEVELFFNTGCAVSDNPDEAIEAVRPYVAYGCVYSTSTKIKGWDESKRQMIMEKYDMYHHFESTQPAGKYVPKEMIAKKSIAGTPDQCIDTIQKIIDNKITSFSLYPFGKDLNRTIVRIGREILPSFR